MSNKQAMERLLRQFLPTAERLLAKNILAPHVQEMLTFYIEQVRNALEEDDEASTIQ